MNHFNSWEYIYLDIAVYLCCWAVSLNRCTFLMTPCIPFMGTFSLHVCMSPCIVVCPIYVPISAYICAYFFRISTAILSIGNCMARPILYEVSSRYAACMYFVSCILCRELYLYMQERNATYRIVGRHQLCATPKL